LDCTYTSVANDETRSCIAEATQGPFLQILEKDCGIITATVTLDMCNLNPTGNSGYTFVPTEGKSVFIINGTVTETLTSNIAPGECEFVEKVIQIDTCEQSTFPMSVKMQGNMPLLGGENTACYAYVHRQNKIKTFPDAVEVNPHVLAPVAPLDVVEECASPEGGGISCSSKVSLLSFQ